MLVSSARHLPTYAKARPAPDALSPGRARFPTPIVRSPWPTTAPRTEYNTSNPGIRVTMSGIQKHADVTPIRFFIDLWDGLQMRVRRLDVRFRRCCPYVAGCRKLKPF